jgi:hypothetical protein
MPYRDLDRQRQRERDRHNAFWAENHSGHDITLRQRRNGSRYRWCLTCHREDDVDPVVVQRAVAGDPPGRLSPAERRAAVAQLRPRLSGVRIAHQLGVTDRTIWRDLATIRTQSGETR